MYHVTLTNKGYTWYLRGTVWTNLERAFSYPTVDAANHALDQAKPFMKRGMIKLAKVTPV